MYPMVSMEDAVRVVLRARRLRYRHTLSIVTLDEDCVTDPMDRGGRGKRKRRRGRN